MNIILLSGGSGTRLWPLSNEVRSKQFLKLFRDENGKYESMLMRMYRMIKKVDPDANVTIATAQNQIPQIRAQLNDNVSISEEPARRDTFPAIALAAAYLKKLGVDDEEPVVVCPVDPYVDYDYFVGLKKMAGNVSRASLTLMGIEPTYPSSKYGYIIPETNDAISKVKEFKEKPDEDTARSYIEKGALWNGGVFAFKLSYLLNISKKVFETDSYDNLYIGYELLPKISFDYAVVEKEPDIQVIRFNGEWKDLGTWNTLAESVSEKAIGKTSVFECENTFAVNELGIPIIALGVSDTVIAATPDGILVSDMKMSSKLKEHVVSSRPMYEQRFWGEYKVLDYKISDDGTNKMIKELVINEGRSISYHLHNQRTEIWTFTEGEGILVINGKSKVVSTGDVVSISPGTRHGIKAVTQLHVIEVQMGIDLTEEDVERFEWRWD